MKAHLTFTLPEEQEQFYDALKGTKNSIIIEEIWDKVFRPYFKHGYADEKLNKLLEDDNCKLLIELLADLYRNIVEEAKDDL